MTEYLSKTQYPYEGKVTVDSMGVYRVVNPISGETLIVKDISQKFRDPLTGAHLKVEDGRVHVVTPGLYQKLLHSSKFKLTDEAEISIQTQRNTIHFNRKTNERVCTAGQIVGLQAAGEISFGKKKGGRSSRTDVY